MELVEPAFAEVGVGIAARPFLAGTEAAVGVALGIAGLPRTAGATTVLDAAEPFATAGAAPIAAAFPFGTIPVATAPRAGTVCVAGTTVVGNGRAVARVAGTTGFAATGAAGGAGFAAATAGAGLAAGFTVVVLFVVVFVVVVGVVWAGVCPQAGKQLSTRRVTGTMQNRTRRTNIEVSPVKKVYVSNLSAACEAS